MMQSGKVFQNADTRPFFVPSFGLTTFGYLLMLYIEI